jgi:hypothetical protein
MGWYDGKVDDKPAKVKEEGTRVEALYNLRPDNKDHIVSNDGVNADYVREGGEVIVDNSRSDNAYPDNQ